MSLHGQTVVLTGSSSGIGAAAARQLAERGAHVALIARRAAALSEVRDSILAAGGRASIHPGDLTDAAEADRVAQELLEQHPRIDALVNNAARSIRRPIHASLDRMHDYERTMAINYFGAVRLTLALTPRFLEQGHGHVVVSSTQSTQVPIPKFSAYLGSKAALESFARSYTAEFGRRGITSTIINFPMVRTEMSSATALYKHLPMIDADRAGGFIVKAVEKRPARISRPLGVLGEIMMATAPGAVLRISRPAFSRLDRRLAAKLARD